MSRLMSVSLTTEQVRARTKTVTRRLGWKFLKPGDRLTLCEKVQGRRKGDPLVRICDVVVVRVDREQLWHITDDDCIAEGFPNMVPSEFVGMFCDHMDCEPDTVVTRIEWAFDSPEARTESEEVVQRSDRTVCTDE